MRFKYARKMKKREKKTKNFDEKVAKMQRNELESISEY